MTEKDKGSLFDKLDRLDERLDTVATKQAEQGVMLDEHMRRTEVAEANLDLLRADFKPVQSHVAMVGALAKILGLVGTRVGMALGLRQLFS